jgi:hypothetical protein
MTKRAVVLVGVLFASAAWPQVNPRKYPWQANGTNCTLGLTFCWYGSDLVTDPEVTAFGFRWASQDKDEKPLEWITAVRCIQAVHLCILARNQELVLGQSITNIDLYRVKEWSEYQIRAVGESDLPPGRECEIDSILLNREDATVSMLSVPGPGATTKLCQDLMKPKTVMYRLQLGLSSKQKETP